MAQWMVKLVGDEIDQFARMIFGASLRGAHGAICTVRSSDATK